VKEKENYWVDKKIELSIKDFKDAKIQEMVMYPPKMKVERREVTSPLPSNASCDIVLYFSKNGQTKIQNLTGNNIRRRLAIILNNQLLMAPLILEKITGETISIVGVSYSEAQSLKSAIKK
jgi:preprotein translocase subunit SecD